MIDVLLALLIFYYLLSGAIMMAAYRYGEFYEGTGPMIRVGLLWGWLMLPISLGRIIDYRIKEINEKSPKPKKPNKLKPAGESSNVEITIIS